MKLEAGTRLGPYEILGAVGAGGMGEVYRARDSRLEREVAIKVRPAHFSDDPEARKRFEREARAASALNHPHICTIYDVGEEQGRYFIAMELIDGCTLSHAIGSRPMRLQEVLRLGIQIADALEAAHKRGIVHRDLKPSNIFVTTRGDAKLLDFGLAKQLEPARPDPAAATLSGPLTSQGEVLGTISYMSPEQAQGKAVDIRSDIFSFGAVLYEMCTARRAFAGDSSADIYAAILRSDPVPARNINQDVPEELQRVIGRALEKDRAERYQSANDLMIDMKRLHRQIFESAAAPLALPSLWPRRKAAATASLLALALVVAMIIVGATSTPPIGLLDSRQITYSPERKEPPLVTDGTRLYFQGQDGPVEMSVNGGPIAALRGSTQGMRMLDVSRDGSQLLAIKPSLGDESIKGSIWSVPVLGGSPTRLGNEMVTDARWLPDGRSVIFMHLRSVFITGPGGANSRKVWEAPGNAYSPDFSPDGRHIRLAVEENHHLRIWELNADGTNAHRLPLEWPADSDQAAGRWSPDGKHFIFQSDAGGSTSLYELIEPSRLVFWKKVTAAKLTSGETEILDTIPSRDSRQLFVMGRISQGVMQVFDSRQKRFIPFLGGLSAAEFVISPDKQLMVYTDYPRHFLWRSRLDGSEKLQLTSSYAAWPRWSPDGKTIAYMDWRSIYLISSDGGTPEKVLPGGEFSEVAPEWTPDGKAISFNDFPRLGIKLKGIQLLDLASRKLSIVPGSEGFYVGEWSPDGKWMVAVAQNPLRMMLYDVQSRSWSELKKFEKPWGYYVWTPDSNSLLLAQLEEKGIYRLTVPSGKWDRMATLEGVNIVDSMNESFLSLTADGQPAIMNDTSVVQIYSLQWKQ